MMTYSNEAPQGAWEKLVRGNGRFAGGIAQHPRQDADRIAEVVAGQTPLAAILGCSDSRAAAELIFDQGLGDLFVVRNAGQIATASAIGSIEFAVAALGVHLVVVLAHESCGAVNSAIAAEQPDAPRLPVHVADMLGPVRASVRALPDAQRGDLGAAGLRHLTDTVAVLLRDSEVISDAIAAGTLGLVGATYGLRDARVVPRVAVGIDAGI